MCEGQGGGTAGNMTERWLSYRARYFGAECVVREPLK